MQATGSGDAPVPAGHQPYLHDLVAAVAAPGVAFGEQSGQIRPSGAQGVFVGDRRIIHRLEAAVPGFVLAPTAHALSPGGVVTFRAVVRGMGDAGPDPTVILQRRRHCTGYAAVERLTVTSYAAAPVAGELVLTVGSDLASVHDVKSGSPPPAVSPQAQADTVTFGERDRSVVVSADRLPAVTTSTDCATMSWAFAVEPGGDWSVEVTMATRQDRAAYVVRTPPRRSITHAQFAVTASDHRLSALVGRGVEDLQDLLLADLEAPQDVFYAAGAPWYFTLFGRDSLWAARMTLPLGTDVAAGTLRALARRQGTADDDERAEAPGKILHELRSAPVVLTGGHGGGPDHATELPPLYYGSVDATALWILLLRDAWRWGLPVDEVTALLPAMRAAMHWLTDLAVDGSGFLRYVDATGTGLANQGWKDSRDGIRNADGGRTRAPVALCEVQGYAVAAARAAGELVTALQNDEHQARQWRTWADDLTGRFRARFWVPSAGGRFPAVALDADGARAASLTSNIGHLLGTGIVDAHEAAAIAARLDSTTMDSGFGLRTLAADAAGYNPLSYHCGSVWVHDTAIVVSGLVEEGTAQTRAVASSLIRGLLRSGEHFGYRLPELLSGAPATDASTTPDPYPASCRPQAWAAGSAIAVVWALLGMSCDAQQRLVTVDPLPGFGAIDVRGLRVGGQRLDIGVDDGGNVTVPTQPAGWTVRIGR